MNKGVNEGIFKIDGIEMPFHCILLNVEKHDNKFYPHYHKYIEILYSLNSDADIYINGSYHQFCTGDLVIINSEEDHDLNFKRAEAQYVVIKVLPEILYTGEQSVFEMKYLLPFIIKNSHHQRVLKKSEMNDDYIHKLMSSIMFEWNRREYGFELSIRADILKMFLWVLRHWRSNNILAIDTFDYSDDMIRLVQSATEYISKNYASVTAADVAKECNLSYSYFSRSFKKIMNQSFSEYLASVKITKAEQLLTTTDYTIADIADKVGFATPSYFIQQFKKRKNISPKQYKLKYTGNKL